MIYQREYIVLEALEVVDNLWVEGWSDWREKQEEKKSYKSVAFSAGVVARRL